MPLDRRGAKARPRPHAGRFRGISRGLASATALVAVVSVASAGCYRRVSRMGAAHPVGAAVPTGEREGPTELRGQMSLDPTSLDFRVEANGMFSNVLGQPYETAREMCREENRTGYIWGYVLGAVGSAIGIGLLASGEDELMIGGGVMLGFATPGWIVPMILDLQHPNGEPYACEAIEEGTRAQRTFAGRPAAGPVTDYAVVISGPGNPVVLSPNEEGVVQGNVAEAFTECSSRVVWRGPQARSDLPGLARWTEEHDVTLTAERQGEQLEGRTVRLSIVNLEGYLRQKADEMIESPIVHTTFTLEDRNTRTIVPGAEVRIRMAPETTEIPMPPEVERFAQRLEGAPCDAADSFRRIAQRVLEAEEHQSRTASACRFEEGQCLATSDVNGQFSVGLYRDRRIHMEIRHDRYYFTELDFGTSDRGAEIHQAHQPVALRDPDRRPHRDFVITLRDVGQRVRVDR